MNLLERRNSPNGAEISFSGHFVLLCESKSFFENTEYEIRGERQCRRRDGSGKNQLIVNHRQTAKNEFAEPAGTDGCGNRRDRYREDGRDANACQ
jgi:hypothetical protein